MFIFILFSVFPSLAMIMWELWYGKDLAKYASMEVQGGLKVQIFQLKADKNTVLTLMIMNSFIKRYFWCTHDFTMG